ncbi:hypothetical protein Clacol_002106 [Clathrus columnatus]|uniref:alpha-1,2-Mannosidase n=1 Tax=Clathrus columnatus TaxID=1419009 RepID=A0AAV5A7M1_9AGAM|nr:hypothetical protein Clacol_002106 [Clathrus columnatus]
MLLALTRTSYPGVKRLPWLSQQGTLLPFTPNYQLSPKFYLDEPKPPNWSYRQQAVKEAFIHAYRAYEEHAFPADEYYPIAGTGRQNFNGWGVTIVDSMDTMHLMGLDEEFDRAVQYVSTMTFDLAEESYAHFFETVIRYLGGLLSAYALSKDPILLKKADELGTKLLPAFNTKTGLPARVVNTRTGRSGESPVLLAEIGSCQLEYRYLAHLTGKAIYYEVVERVNIILRDTQGLNNNSLWASHWETANARQTTSKAKSDWSILNHISRLAHGLIVHNTCKQDKRNQDLDAMQGAIKNLVYLSPTRNLLYVTDIQNNMPSRKFEHLSCFFPGLLTLGSAFFEKDITVSESNTQLHRWVAEGIAYSCWVMYGESATGMGPDEAQFIGPTSVSVPTGRLPNDLWINHLEDWEAKGANGKPPGVSPLSPLILPGLFGKQRDYFSRSSRNFMRPETVESMYLMWKTTGDEIWRERGWEIFKALERNCRLHAGYASVVNVDMPNSVVNNLDDMPSFSLAETWKYLYLLFSPEDTISLDNWVFNTEAHPLPVFDWTEEEITKYRILS